MVVRLNPNRLVQFGFEPLDVLSAIGTAYQRTKVAQTFDGNRIFGVSMILDPADRLDPETLREPLHKLIDSCTKEEGDRRMRRWGDG